MGEECPIHTDAAEATWPAVRDLSRGGVHPVALGANVFGWSVDDGAARRILDAYCLAGCDVIAACRRLGDQGAPYKYPVIYGGRYYATDEPADGWEISA